MTNVSQTSLAEDGLAVGERAEFVGFAREFARERFGSRALELANTHDYPYDVFDELAQAGFFGLYHEPRWGGLGLDLYTICQVIEELSAVSNTVSGLVVGQLQGSLPILISGDDAARAAYLPGIVSGTVRVAMAMTEPEAGSDVLGMQATAIRDGDDFILNGTKVFITMAAVADVITVWAKLNRTRRAADIQGFLIPTDTPGMIIGRPEDKIAASALPSSTITFEDCRIPATARLGPPGEGFRLAMNVLDRIRPVIGVRALGVARGAFEHAVEHLTTRQAFGAPLASFQGLQFMIADMATQIEAARALIKRACDAVETNDPHASRYCAMAKLHASDTAMKVTTDAVQLFGGYGLMHDYPVEHRFREAKIAQIVDGTNQIQRLIIARSILGQHARPNGSSPDGGAPRV
jgi:alkylation response protein AidB-like acyl-CoA dehydrogenase